MPESLRSFVVCPIFVIGVAALVAVVGSFGFLAGLEYWAPKIAVTKVDVDGRSVREDELVEIYPHGFPAGSPPPSSYTLIVNDPSSPRLWFVVAGMLAAAGLLGVAGLYSWRRVATRSHDNAGRSAPVDPRCVLATAILMTGVVAAVSVGRLRAPEEQVDMVIIKGTEYEEAELRNWFPGGVPADLLPIREFTSRKRVWSEVWFEMCLTASITVVIGITLAHSWTRRRREGIAGAPR